MKLSNGQTLAEFLPETAKHWSDLVARCVKRVEDEKAAKKAIFDAAVAQEVVKATEELEAENKEYGYGSMD